MDYEKMTEEEKQAAWLRNLEDARQRKNLREEFTDEVLLADAKDAGWNTVEEFWEADVLRVRPLLESYAVSPWGDEDEEY